MPSSTPPPAPTQTTRVELSPEQRELMRLAMPGVREFAANTPERYAGPTVAGFDPSQTSGQEMVLGAAGPQAGLAQSGADLSNYYMQPDIWNPAQNSMLSSAIDAGTRPIWQGLTENILPSLRSEALNTGGFGGSRQGIAEGLASGRAAMAAGDVGAKMASDLYSTNVQAQMKALGLLPQTQGAQSVPGATTSAVGDVRQAQAQAELNADVGGFNFDQYAPFLQAKEIMALLQGLPGATTVSTGSVPPQPGALQKGVGGALAGAGLGASLGSVVPGVGTLAGAGMGAAGGALLPFLFG